MDHGVIQASCEAGNMGDRAIWGGVVRICGRSAVFLSLAGVLLGFSACSTTNVTAVDPLESRLMALENRSMRLRAGEVQELQEMLHQARQSWPEPDFSKTPDVIVADAPVASRKGNPIGRITAN